MDAVCSLGGVPVSVGPLGVEAAGGVDRRDGCGLLAGRSAGKCGGRRGEAAGGVDRRNGCGFLSGVIRLERDAGGPSNFSAQAHLSPLAHRLSIQLFADAWGIDAIYSGSQKCLSGPPGEAKGLGSV